MTLSPVELSLSLVALSIATTRSFLERTSIGSTKFASAERSAYDTKRCISIAAV